VADATKAWQHLGWRPTRSSIDTIVADAWAWHLKDAQGFGKLSPSKSAEPGPPRNISAAISMYPSFPRNGG